MPEIVCVWEAGLFETRLVRVDNCEAGFQIYGNSLYCSLVYI